MLSWKGYLPEIGFILFHKVTILFNQELAYTLHCSLSCSVNDGNLFIQVI